MVFGCGGGAAAVFPVRQLHDAVRNSHRNRLAAGRAASVCRGGLPGSEAHAAFPVPVVVVFPLFSVEFHRSPVPGRFPAAKRVNHRVIGELRLEKSGLPGEFYSRMSVRTGYEREFVEGFDPSIHFRVGGEARLHRKDLTGEIPVAFFDGIESRFRSEGGKPGRPDVGGDQAGAVAAFEHDFEKDFGVESQDRAPVGREIPYTPEPPYQFCGRVESRNHHDVVHFPHFTAAFVDIADFGGEDEPDIAAAGSRRRVARLQAAPDLEEPLLGGFEHVPKLVEPFRMGEVARSDDCQPFQGRPMVKELNRELLAGRPRESGMDVKIRGEWFQKFRFLFSGPPGLRPVCSDATVRPPV